MIIEDQVCSLELAKKLKELGVKQDGYFIYVGNDVMNEIRLANSVHLVPTNVICSAFISTELLAMLPSKLPIKARATDYECDYDLFMYQAENGEYEVGYSGSGDAGSYCFFTDKKFSNALALTVLYLRQNNLIQL